MSLACKTLAAMKVKYTFKILLILLSKMAITAAESNQGFESLIRSIFYCSYLSLLEKKIFRKCLGLVEFTQNWPQQ